MPGEHAKQPSVRNVQVRSGTSGPEPPVFSLAFGQPKLLLEIFHRGLGLSRPQQTWAALGDAITTTAGLPKHLVLCEWEVFAERFPEDAYRMLLLFIDCYKSNPETCPKPQLLSTSGNELSVEEELERLGT